MGAKNNAASHGTIHNVQYNTQCAIQYTMHNTIHRAVCIIMEIHSLDIVAQWHNILVLEIDIMRILNHSI